MCSLTWTLALFLLLLLFILLLLLPGMCRGLLEWMFPGLMGLPAEARSISSPWSARQSSSSSRRENSSPGSKCLLHTEHLKHSMWYTLSRALITRSLLQKPMLHLAHLIPNNLQFSEETFAYFTVRFQLDFTRPRNTDRDSQTQL